MSDSMSRGVWQWRPPPPDQGQDFGNANAFATAPTLDTLVRETGQNSLDAAVDGSLVAMRYKLIELTKGTAACNEFVNASGLESLISHVVAASEHKQKVGARLRSGLENFQKSDKVTLLRVDDYGTTGLYGRESPRENDESNPYYSLVRNNLDTSKATSTAGGSYGLGKAVNWSLSALLTVLVASELHPRYAGGWPRNKFRISGKAELSWHQMEGEAFAGPGWFSAPDSEYQSMWFDGAELVPLQLNRSDFVQGQDDRMRYGTSLLIVGFAGDSSGPKVIEELERVIARNFWPAILEEQLAAQVEHEVDGVTVKAVSVKPHQHVPSLCDAYEKYVAGHLPANDRPMPGDTVMRPVSLALMPTKPSQKEVRPLPAPTTGDTHLVVRIVPKAYDESDADLIDSVALIRGRRMVVRYLAKKNLLVGGQSFHGLLLAGLAAKNADNAMNVEEFLRAAEPPAHDKWEYSPDLSTIYKAGTGERLKEFFDRITNELKKVVRPQSGDGIQGPLELRRLLRTAVSGPPGSQPKPSLHALRAKYDEAARRWRVSGAVSAPDNLLPLFVLPKLSLEVESGRSLVLDWDQLEVDRGQVLDGDKILVADSTHRIKFQGISARHAKGVPAGASRLGINLAWEPASDDG